MSRLSRRCRRYSPGLAASAKLLESVEGCAIGPPVSFCFRLPYSTGHHWKRQDAAGHPIKLPAKGLEAMVAAELWHGGLVMELA